MNKQPWPVRLLFSLGLLMATMPPLLKEYINMPDFVRGVVAGIGVGMEISAFVLMRRNNKCRSVSAAETGEI